jgi:hypothetical protein
MSGETNQSQKNVHCITLSLKFKTTQNQRVMTGVVWWLPRGADFKGACGDLVGAANVLTWVVITREYKRHQLNF